MRKGVLAVAVMAVGVASIDVGQAGSAAKPLHFVAHLNAAQMANIHSTRRCPGGCTTCRDSLPARRLTGGR